MSAVADIYLLAGSISALMDRDDFSERQRHAIRAVLHSGDADGREATKEEYATLRALALELCDGCDTSDIEHMQRQHY